MIDTKKCMAKRDGEPIFTAHRCQAVAPYATVMGRRCSKHAEELRQALRNPATTMNVIVGRARTEEEIERLVMLLPVGDA